MARRHQRKRKRTPRLGSLASSSSRQSNDKLVFAPKRLAEWNRLEQHPVQECLGFLHANFSLMVRSTIDRPALMRSFRDYLSRGWLNGANG